MKKTTKLSRRDFVHTALGAGVALSAPTILGATAKGRGKTFKIGLIGCGGRGRGAAAGALEAGKILGFNVRVVATADYFKDRAVRAGKQLNVPPERCFGGASCYRDLLQTDAEIVLMATAPLFRPLHLEAAVEAGKHVFIEKPVAVDPPGCRRVIAAGRQAEKKGLVIIAGTEMRHDWNHIKTHQAVAVEKALGKLYAGRVSFCIGHMFWNRPINPKSADDLVKSWQNWISLSGDHLVEQHVHNIDVANWFCGGPPVSAVGFGGRSRRRLQGHDDPHRRPAARGALDLQPAAVGFDDPGRDGHAQPGAVLLAGRVEGLEGPPADLLRHAASRVGHLHLDPPTRHGRGQQHPAARRHRLSRVDQQVAEGPLHLLLVLRRVGDD